MQLGAPSGYHAGTLGPKHMGGGVPKIGGIWYLLVLSLVFVEEVLTDSVITCHNPTRNAMTPKPYARFEQRVHACKWPGDRCRKLPAAQHTGQSDILIWVVVKIMVSFWIPIIIRHLISRVPKKGS